MDHLLEALPDEKIQEFASSEYFVMYKKLFEDLGLGSRWASCARRASPPTAAKRGPGAGHGGCQEIHRRGGWAASKKPPGGCGRPSPRGVR